MSTSHNIGEKNPQAKLNNILVDRIWELKKLGYNSSEIKNSLGISISASTIRMVLTGKSWYAYSKRKGYIK